MLFFRRKLKSKTIMTSIPYRWNKAETVIGKILTGHQCQILFFESQFLQAWKAYGSPLKSDAVAPL